jgi:hypothetical protein
MWCSKFLRSMPGRLLRVAAGLSLIVYGGTHPSLLGLVLMMVGMVPTVTGLAGICLLDEVRQSRHAGDLPPGYPREGRV